MVLLFSAVEVKDVYFSRSPKFVPLLPKSAVDGFVNFKNAAVRIRAH